MATGVGLLLPGVTINSPLGLQCPAAVAATHVALATTAATVLVGLAARRGNSRPKAYQNWPKNSPTCRVLLNNHNL